MAIDDLSIEHLRAREGEKWSHYPADVLPAWVADMDFEIAPEIRRAIEQRVANSDCGYPVAAADSGLPEILAARVREQFDWHIEAGQVDLFNDVVQAIYFGLSSFAEPGEGVIIQTPIYPPFIGATEVTQRRLVLSPLSIGANGFEIDFDKMRAQIDASTKILLLCNPHNPSGRCFTHAELQSLGEIAVAHDLTIISDEIHADLVYAPNRHIPIASVSEEIAARTVTLMSASKAFNIAGICMAFAIYGSPKLRTRMNTVPHHIRGGVSALSVAAVSAALSQAQAWLDEVRAYLHSNRDYLSAHAAQAWPEAIHFSPEATYLSWFDFSAYHLQPDPYRFFLKDAKVALGDGARFGQGGEGCARINFATSRALLEQIVERIDRSLGV